MLGNVVVGAFSVDTLAVIECMYCVHDSRVDLSGCPCFSIQGDSVSKNLEVLKAKAIDLSPEVPYF